LAKPVNISLEVRVCPLAHLEEHIGILRRTAQNRMIGRSRTLAMLDEAIHINERAHVVFIEHFNLVDFMRGAEAVDSFASMVLNLRFIIIDRRPYIQIGVWNFLTPL
jgi:hypothetical protein